MTSAPPPTAGTWWPTFNICGPEDHPTAREVITFTAAETGLAPPWFSVPYRAGLAFGWLMEALHPVLPGPAPFLTRSIVHVARDWWCPIDHATRKLGYLPRVGATGPAADDSSWA